MGVSCAGRPGHLDLAAVRNSSGQGDAAGARASSAAEQGSRQARRGRHPAARADEQRRPTVSCNHRTPGGGRSAELREIRRITVREVRSGHVGFPGAMRRADGSVRVVYRQGESHADPSGRIIEQIGTSSGTHWSTPRVLLDTPGVDDRDPSVAKLPHGRWALTFFRFVRGKLGDATVVLHHPFVAIGGEGGLRAPRQLDAGGLRLEDMVRVRGRWQYASGEPVNVFGCSTHLSVADGRWIVPAYGGPALNLRALDQSPRSRLVLFESSNAGESWQSRPVGPPSSRGMWLQEPALLPLQGGRMLMHVRTSEGASPADTGPMGQLESSDGGKSFTRWKPFDFVGHAPELMALGNDVVASAFREVGGDNEQAWVSFILSADGGRTWSAPTRVVACGDGDCGYPAWSRLEGDKVLLVYYVPGAIRGAIFRLVDSACAN